MIDFVLVPLIVAGLLVNGLRLRARVPAQLPTAGAGPGTAGSAGAVTQDGWAWIAARGVTLDETTRREAASFARAEGLDMVDLVPARLPWTAARDLLRRVDARTYRARVYSRVHSAGVATLLDPELLKRAGVTEPADPEPADVIALDRRVKDYVSRTAAIAVAPSLRPVVDDLAKRRARLRANGIVPAIRLTLDVIPYLLTVVALAVSWPWGLAAVVVYCLQPYLIVAGTSMRPHGLHAAALLRLVHQPYVWVRTVAGRWRSAADALHDAQFADAAAYYRKALADGTARFFEPRRADCPWCGSHELRVRLHGRDLVARKPGEFVLERCAGCGHIFQNPRLTPEGLDFYYRDTYSGVYGGATESIFSVRAPQHRARARMLAPFTTPAAWLDVGTGYGHFCVAAREVWPDTVFDGLDMGEQVEEGQRRGWIATAYRGLFPDLAGRLAGRYDVVSMHHYLEHTREPLAELDAAARMLPAGGYLLVEVPDPQWPAGRLLGKYWMPWLQPQHLNLAPIGNLVSALAERGLRTVATARGKAHISNDGQMAAFLFFWNLIPHRFLPWSCRPPTTATRICSCLIWTVAAPVMAGGFLFDLTLGRVLPRLCGRAGAYRVLARKEEGPADGN